MVYTQSQWLLFFFSYCFLGWIWESCYVSVKKGEWINRGFLRGPIVPIYGFGAVIVLWVTLPVVSNVFLVFLLGMLGATILEYLTGAAMERLFHVRYWDYSSHKYNLNGYICAECSLAWGIFSVFLVKVLHPLVENLVLQIPSVWADLITLLCVILFAADATRAFQSAVDLKVLLEGIEEFQNLKEQIHRMEVELERRRDRRYEKMLQILRRNPSAVSVKFRESFEELRQMAADRKKSLRK